MGTQATLKAIERAQAAAQRGSALEAIEILEAARRQSPFDPDVLIALARQALSLDHAEAALKCLDEALRIEPERLEAIAEAARALRLLGRHEEAAARLVEALIALPDRPELTLALANTQRERGLLSEAEHLLRETLRLKPRSAEARGGLADLLFDRGDWRGAIEEYVRALKDAPRNAQLRLNYALALLHAGDLKRGWRAYEARLEIAGRGIHRNFGAGRNPRRWDGRPLAGASLLIMAEQGLGDQIHFASLFEDLAGDAGEGGRAQILADAEPRLVNLLARTFPHVRFHAYRAHARGGEIIIDYDWVADLGGAKFSIEIASLPGLLRQDFASFKEAPARLVPDPATRARLRGWLDGLGGGPHVAVCWRSGKLGGLRDLQYAPLQAWGTFLAGLGGEIILAQYGARPDEISALEAMCGKRLHVAPGLDLRDDLDGLAALLREVDTVVSAPTVVAALAGAVGTPTLKLTSAGAWTAFGRTREPLAPSVTVIRPERPGDWEMVFARASDELRALPHRV